MTPTTVRMVLVEGEKADGVTVDHDVFDITGIEGSATSSAADQVIAAVLGTQESAAAGGHHLKSIGVTWTDHGEAAALSEALAARGIDDVMLVSELHAAGALAQAVGRAVGYDTTALLFIDRDTATLSVVQTDDGSVVKVLSRTLHGGDAMAVLTEMAEAVDAQDSPPQGMFVVGSGVDVSAVKAHLANLVALPVSAPEEPELALARGAALASAHAPALEASTVGLAYSQDPDGTTAGSVYSGLAGAATQLAPVGGADQLVDDFELEADEEPIEEGRKPFLLVGSALTSIFVVGVVALVISLAVSIRPTVDQRPSPGQSAIVPSTQAPAPAPPVQEAQPVEQPPAPPAETIKAPVPVVQEAPQAPPAPRQVFVEQPAAPAPRAPAPAPPPAAPPPAPAAPIPVPAPPPIYTPPVLRPPVLPPPIIVLPTPNPPPIWRPPWRPPWNPWPQKPPQEEEPEAPQWPLPQRPPVSQVPQAPLIPQPQVPRVPREPQQPLWPRSGSGGSGDSGGSDSGGSDDGGSGRDGGSPIWPWPIGGGGGGGGGRGGH